MYVDIHPVNDSGCFVARERHVGRNYAILGTYRRPMGQIGGNLA